MVRAFFSLLSTGMIMSKSFMIKNFFSFRNIYLYFINHLTFYSPLSHPSTTKSLYSKKSSTTNMLGLYALNSPHSFKKLKTTISSKNLNETNQLSSPPSANDPSLPQSRNPFHLVEFSPWPLTGSMGAFFLTVGTAGWMHNYGYSLSLAGVLLILVTMLQWWRDVVREGTYQGHHTQKVSSGLRWGMILFITSEVCFFFAFFWAYFHSSLAPTPELGCCWPPVGVTPLNPFQVPLLNTAVLLASGVTVTWSHHSMMEGDRSGSIQGLTATALLGVYFTVLQAGEYYEAPFTIADGVYGSTFFVATGFHGLHVLIGTTFLLVCLYRLVAHHFSTGHHFGFEAAAWYWHFVDVVWLFLYISIYWWGS